MKALITGASSGIGRDMSRVLAEKGCDLVLVARSKDKLEEIQDELITKYNSKVKIVEMDLSNIDNCKKLYEDNQDIDLLINNAGFGDCGDFTKTSLDKELNMIDTNIKAYHILMKLYLTDMKKNDRGHILNVASIAGFMPGPLMATYYATKSYVVRLSEGVREELKKDKSNVKISVLCPGPVDTNFNKVANVRFSLKEANSYDVAKYAINHLNKFYIVPGIGVKIARVGVRFIPTNLAARFAYGAQKRKITR
ncbi:MAG: SDR family oxidoreductase [Clostridia bacterium]|nr:SDR family oxidoreductase [Clostridia bacterium]